MEIEINWNSIDISEPEKMEIESNLRNEIINSYEDFEVSTNKAHITLHKDNRSSSIIGVVISENRRIDMTITYSLVNNHAAIYTKKS